MTTLSWILENYWLSCHDRKFTIKVHKYKSLLTRFTLFIQHKQEYFNLIWIWKPALHLIPSWVRRRVTRGPKMITKVSLPTFFMMRRR